MNTKNIIAWSDFHDAILQNVSLDWAKGEARIELETCETSNYPSRKVAIDSLAISILTVPRKHPWGPSIHINELRGPYRKPEKNIMMLEIEMQSGDIIQLEAERIELVMFDQID